jgi:CRP/FNR family transcriptional regulator, cyclic AMP receptor protein
VLVIPNKKRRSSKGKSAHGSLENITDYLAKGPPAGPLVESFPRALRAKLEAISLSVTHLKGHILFAEGQPSRGVFLIEQGRVRLSAESPEGKSLILRIAGPGEIVGLPAAISGRHHEVTAEIMETARIKFIPHKSFLAWVRFNSEAGLRTAELLSEIYYATYRELCYLGLSTSAEARLARFLLGLTCSQNSHNCQAESANISMTHQEIAAVVGLSRETVTRLLAGFKRRGFVKMQSSRLLGVERLACRIYLV